VFDAQCPTFAVSARTAGGGGSNEPLNRAAPLAALQHNQKGHRVQAPAASTAVVRGIHTHHVLIYFGRGHWLGSNSRSSPFPPPVCTPALYACHSSNPEQMAAAQREAVEANGFKPRSGKQNAQIGLKGFTQVQCCRCWTFHGSNFVLSLGMPNPSSVFPNGFFTMMNIYVAPRYLTCAHQPLALHCVLSRSQPTSHT